jgi:hypothetical protein
MKKPDTTVAQLRELERTAAVKAYHHEQKVLAKIAKAKSQERMRKMMAALRKKDGQTFKEDRVWTYARRCGSRITYGWCQLPDGMTEDEANNRDGPPAYADLHEFSSEQAMRNNLRKVKGV